MARHPKGLYLLFVTEMWERFSYYGMRALLVLYMTNALLFDKSFAAKIYGSYTSLVYLTPLLGGYIADRYWGNRRSIIVGGLLMAAGQLGMFSSGSILHNRDLAIWIMSVGLGLLILGNGFFKPNISTMVGQLYPKGDRRVDAAFTIFYMGINLGALLAPLVCGAVGEHRLEDGSTVNEDFRWGFLAAAIGMLISLFFFVLYKNRYIITPEGEPIGVEPNKARDTEVAVSTQGSFALNQLVGWGLIFVALSGLFYYGFAVGLSRDFGKVLEKFDFNALISALIFAAAIAIPGFIISDRNLQPVERDRIWVIYIAAFFVIFFWSAFEQAGASLTYFAEEQTQRVVDLHVPVIVILFASIVAAVALAGICFWGLRALRDEPLSLSVILCGVILAALGYLVWQNTYFIRNGQTEWTYREIPASFFQTVNATAIVIFAPFFSSMWTYLGNRQAEPPSLVKQSLGLLLLALGYVLIALKVKDLDPTLRVSMFWLIALYVVHTWGELCLSPIGLSMVSKLSPARFASLLMGVWFLSNAVANNFAGWLSALYPPSEKEFHQAAEKGINLPAILNGTITPTHEQLQTLEKIGVRASYPEVFGFQIHDLFQFFMIFVVSSGLASVVLFLLSRKLIRMMHGIR